MKGSKRNNLTNFFSALLIFALLSVSSCSYPEPDRGPVALLIAMLTHLDYTVTVNTTEGPDGVPSISELSGQNTNYEADGVENWWQDHKFNPDHDEHITAIRSPSNIVDVYAEFGSNIQAAIDSLPESGGTLFFAPTTFRIPSQGLYIAHKNNVHFIGVPGKTVFLANSRETMITLECGSGEISGYPDCYANATSNYLFDGIIFDGNNVSNKALSLYSVKDIVVRNCTFKDFLTHENGGDAMIHSGAWADNIWIMDSVFTGRGKYAILLDGTHYSGILNSTFDHYIYPTAIVFLTNDDLTRDVNYNDTWDGNEIRYSNYVVVEGNTFGAEGDKNVSSLNINVRNALIQKNTVKGNGHFFVRFDAKCPHIPENADTGLPYDYYYHKILNNTIDGRMNYFAEFWYTPNNCISGSTTNLGKYEIKNNTVNGGIIVEEIRHCNTIQEPNTISGNTAAWSPVTSCSN